MYLQKLEIQGFKSFASKTTLLFPVVDQKSKGVTAVVGPNGSGKSNIADAIRWVLGEQSLKLLRGKRAEDVIFFGSDKKGQLGFAEVSLFFNNEDGAFPIEYAEVVITRRLYRSGDSEYLVNNNKVRLADINLMLASAHVGQRSYSVIGQGMVDSIINAAPAERKEFFYEAAGVKQYQIKKDQAVLKLKSTNENLAQVDLLLNELEPKLRFFERQIKRLEAREELAAQLMTLMKTFYHSQWSGVCVQLSGLQTSLAGFHGDVIATTARHQELEKRFETYERENGGEGREEVATAQSKYDALIREKNKLSQEKSILSGRLQLNYEQRGEANKAWLLQRRDEVEGQLEVLGQQLSGAKEKIAHSEQEQREVAEQTRQLEEQLQALRIALKEAMPTTSSVSLEEVHARLSAVVARLRNYSSNDELASVLADVSEVSVILDGVAGMIKKSFHRDTQGYERVEGQIKEVELKKASISASLQSLRVEIGVSRHGLTENERQIANLTRERGEIEKKLAFYASSERDEQEKILNEQIKTIDDRLLALTTELSGVDEALRQLRERDRSRNSAVLTLQREMALAQRELDAAMQKEYGVKLEIARAEARQEELFRKIGEEFSVDIEASLVSKQYDEIITTLWNTAETPVIENAVVVSQEIHKLKARLDQIGSIDEEALAEYESTKERFEFLTMQLTDLHNAITSLQKAIAELETEIRERFNESISSITILFQEYFARLFNGGVAKLVLLKKEKDEDGDEDDEAEGGTQEADVIAGIEIQVCPPGKKLKSISVLSGGEKAMTSIGLICAIIANNPSPFVLLDEVDAALDDANAFRFAHIISELSQRTQFIIVTHSQVTMQAARTLYGVTMGDDGISKVLSLDFERVGAFLDK